LQSVYKTVEKIDVWNYSNFEFNLQYYSPPLAATCCLLPTLFAASLAWLPAREVAGLLLEEALQQRDPADQFEYFNTTSYGLKFGNKNWLQEQGKGQTKNLCTQLHAGVIQKFRIIHIYFCLLFSYFPEIALKSLQFNKTK